MITGYFCGFCQTETFWTTYDILLWIIFVTVIPFVIIAVLYYKIHTTYKNHVRNCNDNISWFLGTLDISCISWFLCTQNISCISWCLYTQNISCIFLMQISWTIIVIYIHSVWNKRSKLNVVCLRVCVSMCLSVSLPLKLYHHHFLCIFQEKTMMRYRSNSSDRRERSLSKVTLILVFYSGFSYCPIVVFILILIFCQCSMSATIGLVGTLALSHYHRFSGRLKCHSIPFWSLIVFYSYFLGISNTECF